MIEEKQYVSSEKDLAYETSFSSRALRDDRTMPLSGVSAAPEFGRVVLSVRSIDEMPSGKVLLLHEYTIPAFR